MNLMVREMVGCSEAPTHPTLAKWLGFTGKKHDMKILVFLFPITLFLIFLCIKLVSPSTYILIIQEDSAKESILGISRV